MAAGAVVALAIPNAQPAAAQVTAGDCTFHAPGFGAPRQDLAAEVVALVNQHRMAMGLPVLRTSPSLTRAALWKSGHMIAGGYFTHTDLGMPGGDRGFATRINDCGYLTEQTEPEPGAVPSGSLAWGENIAQGMPTAQQVMAAWLNSPSHRANIEQEAFTHIGVGASSSAGLVRWTQNFGRRDGTPVLPPPAITAAPDVVVVPEDSGPIVVAPLANDNGGGADPLSATFDVAAGPLGSPSADDDRVTLHPSRDANGMQMIPYTAVDFLGRAAPGVVSITVTPVPDRPTAQPDRARFSRRGNLVRVAVLANDRDPDGEPLRVRVTGASQGLRATVRSGRLVITRRSIRIRSGLVRYRVTDPTGRSSRSLVRVTTR